MLNQGKGFIEAREVALHFLSEYIKLLGRRIQTYALEVKVCNAAHGQEVTFFAASMREYIPP